VRSAACVYASTSLANIESPKFPAFRQERDNKNVPYIPTGFINQAQLADAVDQAVRKLRLGTEVVRVRHSIGVDTSGEPSIFFRIVLSDAASREATLADVTGNIATVLFDELRPYENWGLIPYFSFRSASEQAIRHEPEWA
jgi:hypothetical protein